MHRPSWILALALAGAPGCFAQAAAGTPPAAPAPQVRLEGSAFVLRTAQGTELRGEQLVGQVLDLPGGPTIRIRSVSRDRSLPDLVQPAPAHLLVVDDEKELRELLAEFFGPPSLFSPSTSTVRLTPWGIHLRIIGPIARSRRPAMPTRSPNHDSARRLCAGIGDSNDAPTTMESSAPDAHYKAPRKAQYAVDPGGALKGHRDHAVTALDLFDFRSDRR